MQTAETVREVSGRAVEIQQAQQSKKVRNRRYKVGDQVMMYSPPHGRDKLHSQPWTGPHQIIEISSDHVVKLRMFRGPAPVEKKKGRKPVQEQWVTTSRLKPVFKSGRPYKTLPAQRISSHVGERNPLSTGVAIIRTDIVGC